MSLELSQIYDLRDGRVDPIKAGIIPDEVADYLSAKFPHAYLSRYSLNHIMKEHPHLTYFDLLLVPEVLKKGLWIAETKRPNSACVTWQEAETGVRYISAVKVAAAGFELYVPTFHRAKARQTRSLLKRGAIIRTHL